MLRHWRKPYSLLATGLLSACSAHAGPGAPSTSPLETVTIRVHEGTDLAFDISPDGRTIVFDLLGQLWLLPASGGRARAITDAVRDTAEYLDPSFASDGRRLLLQGERRGRIGTWLLELETGAIRQLGESPLDDGYEGPPAWSADGRQIGFARMVRPESAGAPLRSEVVLLDVAGGARHALPIEGLAGPFVRDPTWLKDGRVGFVVQHPMMPRGGPIATADPAGGIATLATPDSVRALAPAFSPDGRRVAYFSPDTAGRVQVWLRDVGAASSPIRLTDHTDVTPTRIRWMPDGKSVVYAADGRLWRVAPLPGAVAAEIPFSATLSIRRARPGRAQAALPAPGDERPARGFMDLELSPDGGRIAILALGKLWIVPAGEGGTPRAAADVPHDARHLAWAADGSTLAWSSGRLLEEDIFATELATGETNRVTALSGREVYPAFSPDGRSLAFIHRGTGEDTARVLVIEAGRRGLTDAREARRLGVFDLGWLAGDALVPQWSPGSDAMLDAIGGFSPGSPTHGELMALAGAQRRFEPFPDSPIYLQWIDGALFYVRHDRLWRLPFDTAGPGGSPIPLGTSPALYASAARDGTILFVSDSGLRLRRPDGSERVLGWPLSFAVPVPHPLVIRNVRLIDGSGGGVSEPRDVVVERGRVARILPAGTAGEAAEVLDAGGRIAIPGLFDLHEHVYAPSLLPGFAYFGVTTIRDQGAPMAPLAAYAEAIAAEQLEGPRIGYGGFQYYSDWAFDTDDGRGVEPEADSAHVARAVALAAAFGSTHIKTRTFRRWDINARMVAEAHRRGMRATGHCAHQLPLIAAGMDAMEHVGMCGDRGAVYLYDDLVQLFRAADVGVVPTIIYWSFAVRVGRDAEPLADDAELAQFLPSRESLGWMLAADSARRHGFGLNAERARRNTVRLARRGVLVGTGTDIWQVPAGVHLEMQEMVTAGLTPLEAIRAATSSSAKILGADADLGTIAVGKLADLVILDADPTTDIRNSRRIWKVLKAGRVVDREGIVRRLSGRAGNRPE